MPASRACTMAWAPVEYLLGDGLAEDELAGGHGA